MSFASSNRTAINVIKEATLDTMPANPAFQALRYTGESLNFNISNITSNEISSDRMTTDLIQVQADSSGDINFELSYGTFDQLIEGAMAAEFGTATNVTNTSIDASSADDSFNAGSSIFADIEDGQWIRVSGFSNAANNGLFKVVTATATKLIVNDTLVTEAAGASITVKGEMVRNGTSLMSFSIQKHLQDATPETFFNYTGMRVGSMSLDFRTGQILTGSFSFMGMSLSVVEAQVSGATVAPVSTSDVMNAVNDVSRIDFDGVTSSAKFSNLTLNIDNGVRAQDAMGSLSHVGIALGRLQVTGNISLYFENKTMYEKYLNATAFALSFAVQDADNQAYVITLPRVKFETGSVESSGLDSDVLMDATWRAIKDPTTSCMIQIDKV